MATDKVMVEQWNHPQAKAEEMLLWLVGDKWHADRATDRKLRLLACTLTKLGLDSHINYDLEMFQDAVVVVERFADRQETKQDKQRLAVNAMTKSLYTATNPLLFKDYFGNSYPEKAKLTEQMTPALLREFFGNAVKPFPEVCCRVCRGRGQIFVGWGHGWQDCSHCNGGVMPGYDWLNSRTYAMAKLIYDDHTFADMPILADALEEAGCADVVILEHCRSQEPHYRGCWVLDTLLGKV